MASPPSQTHNNNADSTSPDTSGTPRELGSPIASSNLGLGLDGAEEMLNGYLALFASFRRGKHPFLKPYMRLLGNINFLK